MMANRSAWFRGVALGLVILMLGSGCSTTQPLRAGADADRSTTDLQKSDIGRWLGFELNDGETVWGYLVAFDDESIEVRKYNTSETISIVSASVVEIHTRRTHLGRTLLAATGACTLALVIVFWVAWAQEDPWY